MKKGNRIWKTRKLPSKSIKEIEKYIYKRTIYDHYLTETSEFYNVCRINDIFCNVNSRLVAVFKDYLLSEDWTEFLECYFKRKSARGKLKRLISYYTKNFKIYPNYAPLYEAKFISKNIRKKQKLLDILHNSKQKQTNSSLNDTIFNSTIIHSILDLTKHNSELFKIMNLKQKTKRIEPDSFDEIDNVIHEIDKYEPKNIEKIHLKSPLQIKIDDTRYSKNKGFASKRVSSSNVSYKKDYDFNPNPNTNTVTTSNNLNNINKLFNSVIASLPHNKPHPKCFLTITHRPSPKLIKIIHDINPLTARITGFNNAKTESISAKTTVSTNNKSTSKSKISNSKTKTTSSIISYQYPLHTEGNINQKPTIEKVENPKSSYSIQYITTEANKSNNISSKVVTNNLLNNANSHVGNLKSGRTIEIEYDQSPNKKSNLIQGLRCKSNDFNINPIILNQEWKNKTYKTLSNFNQNHNHNKYNTIEPTKTNLMYKNKNQNNFQLEVNHTRIRSVISNISLNNHNHKKSMSKKKTKRGNNINNNNDSKRTKIIQKLAFDVLKRKKY